jgi:hypothetical protein
LKQFQNLGYAGPRLLINKRKDNREMFYFYTYTSTSWFNLYQDWY